MEIFIEFRGNLFDRYEFSACEIPKPKVLKERRKLVAEGKAKIIYDEADFGPYSTEKKKIVRKI